jgi:hypothetical protein
MKKIAVSLMLLVASFAFCQGAKPSVYLEPQQGFETYIAAAIAKKGVPVDVVAEKSKATYILRSAPVEVKSESTGGKVARCLFAYCAGIEDKSNVSVQLIEAGSTKMVWAYSVNKQRGGGKNEQAMAEAIAKHLKEFLPRVPALSQTSAATESLAPTPIAAAAAIDQPTAVSTATQRSANAASKTTQVTSQDDSDAARKAQQRNACLELAKDNPTITCN